MFHTDGSPFELEAWLSQMIVCELLQHSHLRRANVLADTDVVRVFQTDHDGVVHHKDLHKQLYRRVACECIRNPIYSCYLSLVNELTLSHDALEFVNGS